MTEKEFEFFCKQKFNNPDFLLGRQTKKDTTADAQDHFVGADNKDNGISEVNDISDFMNRKKDSDIEVIGDKNSITKSNSPNTKPSTPCEK